MGRPARTWTREGLTEAVAGAVLGGCQAAGPAEAAALPLPQAITTEGKYWRSRIEIVIREYHKWRAYFKKRVLEGLRARGGGAGGSTWPVRGLVRAGPPAAQGSWAPKGQSWGFSSPARPLSPCPASFSAAAAPR